MSRAFVKEDVDPPERSGRVRSASGLPPGAANYITATGAARFRRELESCRGDSQEEKVKREELEHLLASVVIVEAPTESSDSVAFGARVTLHDGAGNLRTYRIVGVDELAFEADAISWISPDGKTLLAADLGDKVTLSNGTTGTIIEIKYPD